MVKIKDIKDFINLPDKAKILYFYLSESTDEYDLVERPEQIVIAIGANEDDLKELIEKRFLITCENGVIVVKNYKLRNVLLGEELKVLSHKNTIKISEDSIQKVDVRRAIEEWNKLQNVGVAPVVRATENSPRIRNLKSKLRKYTFEQYLQALENIRKSPFLQGNNKQGWMITFKWFVEKDNFDKVLSGQYNPHRKEHTNGNNARSAEPLIPLEEWNGGESDTPFI